MWKRHTGDLFPHHAHVPCHMWKDNKASLAGLCDANRHSRPLDATEPSCSLSQFCWISGSRPSDLVQCRESVHNVTTVLFSINACVLMPCLNKPRRAQRDMCTRVSFTTKHSKFLRGATAKPCHMQDGMCASGPREHVVCTGGPRITGVTCRALDNAVAPASPMVLSTRFSVVIVRLTL